jgi:hypothetical protein
MTLRISFIFVATVWLSGFIVCESRDYGLSHHKEPSDSVGGSGGWGLHFSDDEDFMDSGSGSGREIEETDEPVKPRPPVITSSTTGFSRTTDHTLSDCESMRQASQSLLGKFAPRCLPNGDFDALQCHGYPGTSDCWCSDMHGREVPGTLMEAPNFPSCEDGNNLPPCVHQLVKSIRSKVLGGFRPKCSVDGQFDRMQCHGSMCFCVEEGNGSRVSGTETQLPVKPKCGTSSSANAGMPEITTKERQPDTNSEEGDIDIDDTDQSPQATTEVTKVDLGLSSNDGKSNQGKKGNDKYDDEDYKTGKAEEDIRPKPNSDPQQEDKVEKANDIMTQPGILAGIIGGSVVLLLCLVLLAMFIVYRMRKKDEGSYPLDEPRKTPNYSYVRAPEKEFYA